MASDEFDLQDDEFNLGPGEGFGLDGAADEPDGVALVSYDFDGALPDAELAGTFEEEAKTEISDTLRRMHEISEKAKERFKTACDTDYLLCVVFLSQGQKNEFLEALGWKKCVGGGNGRYVNGLALARSLGVQLSEVEFKPFEPKA